MSSGIINYAIRHIKQTIYKEILDIAFNTGGDFKVATTSIDELIYSNVINDIVLKDNNAIDYKTIKIDMSRVQVIATNPTNYMIKVPANDLANRRIMNARSISSYIPDGNRSNGIYGSTSPLVDAASRMFQQDSLPSSYHNAKIDVVGPDTLLVHGVASQRIGSVLVLDVSNDANLSHITSDFYDDFAEMCIKAAEGYIHLDLKFKIAKGYIYNGHTLDLVNSVVDEFKESRKEYNAIRGTKWRKILFVNDSVKLNSLITNMIG